MLLEGRKAIVTGGSSGIGRAIAQRLGREGAHVCVNYYSPKEYDAAQEVVERIERDGQVHTLAVQGDVGNEDDVTRMVSAAAEAFDGVDILVNNAGIEKQIPLLETSMQDWERISRTNLSGAFLCIREAGKVMAGGGGGLW